MNAVIERAAEPAPIVRGAILPPEHVVGCPLAVLDAAELSRWEDEGGPSEPQEPSSSGPRIVRHAANISS